MGDMLNDNMVDSYLALLCRSNLQYQGECLLSSYAPFNYADVPDPPRNTELSRTPARPRKLKERVELPIGDKWQSQDFSKRLKTVVSQIPYDGEDSKAVELYLESLSKLIADTTEYINNTYSTGTRDTYKDAYSPEFMIQKCHLQTIIEVHRRFLGKKGRNRWCSYQDRQ